MSYLACDILGIRLRFTLTFSLDRKIIIRRSSAIISLICSFFAPAGHPSPPGFSFTCTFFFQLFFCSTSKSRCETILFYRITLDQCVVSLVVLKTWWPMWAPGGPRACTWGSGHRPMLAPHALRLLYLLVALLGAVGRPLQLALLGHAAKLAQTPNSDNALTAAAAGASPRLSGLAAHTPCKDRIG